MAPSINSFFIFKGQSQYCILTLNQTGIDQKLNLYLKNISADDKQNSLIFMIKKEA